MPIIVVNDKPNITHMPYADGEQKGVFSFLPGQNRIDPKIWQAVKKDAGKSMDHYGTFLKPIGEDAPEEEINIAKLSADDAVTLAGGAMNLALLEVYAADEKKRKGGARKSVMEAIERQTAEIQAIEDKKAVK